MHHGAGRKIRIVELEVRTLFYFSWYEWKECCGPLPIMWREQDVFDGEKLHIKPFEEFKGTHSTMQLVEKEVKLATARESRVSLPAKQPKLDFSREPRVTLEELNQLVAGYIVEEMLPLSTVDSSSFRRIIDKIPSNNNVHLPHRKSFTSYLENEYKKMKAALKLALDDVQFVSTTADIWTANNRSYMGVTIHWFNQDTLERHKAALACKRVRGRHTFDVIAAELEQIHSSFSLLNKLVATVTDNASNFVKAFKTFPPPESDEDEKEEEEEEEQEDVLFTDIAEALTAVSDEGHITLPPHYRCALHTINLISTSDVEKYLTSSPTTKSVYRVTIAKCTALWTKASRSTVAAEQVQEVSQRKLLVPSSTRWNSFYDAVSRVAEIPMNELNNLCNKLCIKCFNEKEYQFMHEYCIAMKPLTAALDILQGDECPYGALLPTLEILMTKNTCAIQTRFSIVLDNKDALLAAISCPKFKLRWVKDGARKQQLKNLLVAECQILSSSAGDSDKTENVPNKVVTPVTGMEFFEFESEPEDCYSADQEVMNYLSSGGFELDTLSNFPAVKKVFLKYNTPTPSSAPVERLFSLGGLVLTQRRNRLSDSRFEKLLLMRYNHCFTSPDHLKKSEQ
uniref:HAT C-terminal dimerisation domain-containing protein n=1 Tax=Oryzias latipes TaxID=8090 RepID=A0A3P9KHU5_ORYLA